MCAALLVAVVCCVLLPSGVDARSNGQLIASGCDLSPQVGWPNGRFGRNKTGAGNAGITIGVDSNIMRSGAEQWRALSTGSSSHTQHCDTRHAHGTREANPSSSGTVQSWDTGRHAPPYLTLTDCMRIL